MDSGGWKRGGGGANALGVLGVEEEDGAGGDDGFDVLQRHHHRAAPHLCEKVCGNLRGGASVRDASISAEVPPHHQSQAHHLHHMIFEGAKGLFFCDGPLTDPLPTPRGPPADPPRTKRFARLKTPAVGQMRLLRW